MADREPNEILIGKLLKACVSNNIDVRAQYIDGLVDALSVYIDGKADSKTDLVRKAIKTVYQAYAASLKDPKLIKEANKWFDERFITSYEMWYDPEYYEATLLSADIDRINQARGYADEGQKQFEIYLARSENGYKNAMFNFGRALNICLRMAIRHKLIEFDEGDEITDFTVLPVNNRSG